MTFFGSLSASAAAAWLFWAEIGVLAFSLVLGLGLIGEFPEGGSWRKSGWYVAAKIAVVTGVLGELLSDGAIYSSSARLQTLQEIENTRLVGLYSESNSRAGRAVREAAKANERAAQLEKDAAQLRVVAAEANRKAMELAVALEKFKAPRMLSLEQQNAATKALKPFSGQEYALSVAPGKEASDLLCVLDNILTLAGWQKHAVVGTVMVGTECGPAAVNTLTGIDARRGENSSQNTIDAVQALRSALSATDAPIRPAVDPVNIPIPNVIVLMVGTKPQ